MTPSHVVQVSDRRLTWLTGPNAGQVAPDDRNKALVVCNRLVIAYTGLAEVAGNQTDEWLLEVVSTVVPYNPQRVCETVAERAAEEFRKVRLPRSAKRHAFLVSGWARFNSKEASFTPFISAVSNALDGRWSWLSNADNVFRVRTVPLGDRPFILAAVGQPISSTTRKCLRRQVRNYSSRERGPEGYIQMLAKAIRDTAIFNRAVGRNLMAISLPRTTLEQDRGLSVPLARPVQSRKALALYLPESGDVTIRYAPNYTCGGISFKQFVMRRKNGEVR